MYVNYHISQLYIHSFPHSFFFLFCASHSCAKTHKLTNSLSLGVPYCNCYHLSWWLDCDPAEVTEKNTDQQITDLLNSDRLDLCNRALISQGASPMCGCSLRQHSANRHFLQPHLLKRKKKKLFPNQTFMTCLVICSMQHKNSFPIAWRLPLWKKGCRGGWWRRLTTAGGI